VEDIMQEKKIVIEGSGKHCHVTKETFEALFGEGTELEVKKYLSQPGQFATPFKVTVEGPKGKMALSILGPFRSKDQVELSLTDARALGLTSPIRESGDLAGSEGCKLIGPRGEVTLKEGVIIAKRHIHMTPEDAEKFGVRDKQIVKVKTSGERGLIFDQVVIRVSPDYATYMHVDYDELNAAALFGAEPVGEILV
jgi:putative phosphotransacetylase